MAKKKLSTEVELKELKKEWQEQLITRYGDILPIELW